MDLSLVYDWIIQTLKGLSGSTILSVISVYIAYNVFRFNQRMGYSKLSVSPLISKYDESMDLTHIDFTYQIKGLHDVKTVKGLPEPMIARVLRDPHNTYLNDDRFTNQMLLIKLINKGEIASTDIKISLVYKGYGTRVRYKKDRIDDLDFEVGNRKLVKTVKVPIKIPYMGAGEEKLLYLTDLVGQFRETELILCKIQANGHTYFKQKLSQKFRNRVVINHYSHPYLKGAADSSDIRILVGFHNSEPSALWDDPYKKNKWYEGGIKWLRNLYAEWRK